MDPNAAYRMMAEHYNAGEYHDAHVIADGLLDWLRKGGFPPTVFTERRSAILACRAMLGACDTMLQSVAS